MIAFVRGVMCASRLAGSICSVSGSMSQKTTAAPKASAPVQLAQYVTDVQMISSPGPMPTAYIDAFRAFVPLLCESAYFLSCHDANDASKRRAMSVPDMLPVSSTCACAARMASLTIGQWKSPSSCAFSTGVPPVIASFPI